MHKSALEMESSFTNVSSKPFSHFSLFMHVFHQKDAKCFTDQNIDKISRTSFTNNLLLTPFDTMLTDTRLQCLTCLKQQCLVALAEKSHIKEYASQTPPTQ